jgi:hypothetical protein
MISNPQRRYRLYVAGDQEWATWFGASNPKSVLGYATQIEPGGPPTSPQ